MGSRTKRAGQILVGLGAGTWLWLVMRRCDPEHASRVYIPFDGYWDLGAMYPLVVALVVVAASNAVNITDGLDGLAGGPAGGHIDS